MGSAPLKQQHHGGHIDSITPEQMQTRNQRGTIPYGVSTPITGYRPVPSMKTISYPNRRSMAAISACQSETEGAYSVGCAIYLELSSTLSIAAELALSCATIRLIATFMTVGTNGNPEIATHLVPPNLVTIFDYNKLGQYTETCTFNNRHIPPRI